MHCKDLNMDEMYRNTLSEWKSATCSVEIALTARNSSTDTSSTSLRCDPLNHNFFLERVATFSIATWCAKPPPIDVYQAARHGWVNSITDILTCSWYDQSCPNRTIL